MVVYLGDWSLSGWVGGVGREAMLHEFAIDETALQGLDVLLAYYAYENKAGRAYVLLRRLSDGVLLEVRGSHSLRDGLEGQWKPEVTTLAAIRQRLTECVTGFHEQLTEVVKRLEVNAPA